MTTPNHNSFDVSAHLETRRNDPNLHVVEFGHGLFPIAFQQGEPFTGNRSYIGIEGWLDNPEGNGQNLLAQRYKKQAPGQNISFITQNLGKYPLDEDGFPIEELYEGEYNTLTPLETGKASEVVASNVFTDPMVASAPFRSINLMGEMKRILKPSGLIILRETLTPWLRDYIDDGTVALAGLQVVAKLNHSELDPTTWNLLEDIYDGDRAAKVWQPSEGSHYTILGN